MSGGNGGWVPITQGVVTEFPKNRPFTRIEALLSVTIDFHHNRRATLRGYAQLWQWKSVGKVARFLAGIGVEILQKSEKKRNSGGTLMILPVEQQRNSGGTLKALNFNYLSAAAEQQRNNDGTTTGQQRDNDGTYYETDKDTEKKKAGEKPGTLPSFFKCHVGVGSPPMTNLAFLQVFHPSFSMKSFCNRYRVNATDNSC